MTIKALVFDIGGVLVSIPSLGVFEKWENQIGLSNGELARKIGDISHAGCIGTINEAEFRLSFGEILQLGQEEVNEFMEDMWEEYFTNTQQAIEDIEHLLRTS